VMGGLRRTPRICISVRGLAMGGEDPEKRRAWMRSGARRWHALCSEGGSFVHSPFASIVDRWGGQGLA